MKTYIFRVSIVGRSKLWRKLELSGEQTLEDLHFAIQEAFDFDNDHLYSFFMSGKAWDSDTEYCLPEGVSPWGEDMFDFDEEDSPDLDEAETETPEPTPEELEQAIREQVKLMGLPEEFVEQFLAFAQESDEPDAQDVRAAKLDDLNLEMKKKFLYLFDYGDEWRFTVQVQAINPQADETVTYPRVVQAVGTPPKQYPDYEDWESETDEQAGAENDNEA